MKKNISSIKYALLSFSSIFLGCNILQINDNVKVIKNDTETIIDLGNKNGADTKINLNVKSDLFNTKAFIPGYSGQILPLNNTTLILKLNRFNTGTNPPSPYDRFTDASVVTSIPLANINTTTPIKLKGLNLGKDYYISAKLYRNELLIDPNVLTLNTSNSTSVTSSGGNFTSLNIVPGDIIRIGSDTTEYEVITVAPTNYHKYLHELLLV